MANRSAVTTEDLIEFNQRKLMAQDHLLDSLVEMWNWNDAPSFNALATGLRIVLRESSSRDEALYLTDDSVRWNVDVKLVDSTDVMFWSADQPLVFHGSRSAWPSGFQELADALNIGDSAECLMPAHLAWGLTGWSNRVPQDAALLFRIRVLPVEQKVDTAQRMSNWIQVISRFEKGTFEPEPEWCSQPVLIGSSCLAWGDRKSKSPAVKFVRGTPVSLKMRTQVLESSEIRKDLGWRTWEYEWGDEGQCLPIIEELMAADWRFKRWECWCPAEKAFGAKGFPEAGIYPDEVVGFQWEILETPKKQQPNS